MDGKERRFWGTLGEGTPTARLEQRLGREVGGVSMPSSRGLPNPGIKSVAPLTPALQVDSFLLSHGETLEYGELDLHLSYATSLAS